jgi:hypothetical protein
VIGLSTIGSKMKSRGRLVLSVFVIAWINTTLQPCLMAMEVSPNKPASISASAEHDVHQNHASGTADHQSQACPHCPPNTSHVTNTCAITLTSGCDELPQTKPGERIQKVDLSDAFGDAHSSYHYYCLDRSAPVLLVVSPDSLKPTFVVGPSISIRNCVFLK